MKKGFYIKWFLFIVILIHSFEIASQSQDTYKRTTTDTPTIKNILMNAKEYSTFVGMLKTTNTLSQLETDGVFIVFAPTNQAFSKMPLNVLKQLKEPQNIKKLYSIINYHLIRSDLDIELALNSSTTREVRLTALNGLKLDVKLCPEECLSITDANGFSIAVNNKTLAKNGVVYSIDEVLLPQVDVTTTFR